MGQDDDPCAGLAKRLKSRQDTPDTGIIADLTIGQGYIEIKPDKAPPPGGVDFIHEQKRRVHKLFLI